VRSTVQHVRSKDGARSPLDESMSKVQLPTIVSFLLPSDIITATFTDIDGVTSC
jgi:hypothetical protein